jgi:peptide/nickel transport system substrate-binding protein
MFKKFANYWRKAPDGTALPYLDWMELRWIADASVALIELKTGVMQMFTYIQPRDMPGIKSNPDYVLQEWAWQGSVNMLGLGPKQGPFATNMKLRLAAQYAIDRKAMSDTLGLGSGVPGRYIIAPGQPGYSESLPYYSYNLDKAKQLVTEAGYPNGADFGLSVIARQPDLPQAEVIKSMLEKAGLRASIESMDRLAFMSKVKAQNFDTSTYGVGYEIDPYIVFARRMACDGNVNFTAWCNPSFDKCLAESELAPNDQARGQIFQRCYQISYDEAYYVHLWAKNRFDVYSKKLHGWGPYQRVMGFWNELWLE